MTQSFGLALLAFTSLLAMVDPIGVVPIFLAETSNNTAAQRAQILRRAILTAFLVLVSFGLLGTGIFRFFGITPYAFRIAGGILLFSIGSEMLRARPSRTRTTAEEEQAGAEKEDISIIPLGLPLLAGPGAITTVVALISRAHRVEEHVGVYLAIAAVLAVTWAVLSIAPKIMTRIGPTGMKVVERIMGLIVMVIGVQFVIDGAGGAIQEILPRLQEAMRDSR